MEMVELTVAEKKVILALEGEKGVEAKRIAEKASLNEDAVIQAAFMLAKKGLVAIKEDKRVFYRLTEEGKEYVEKGLPERRMVEFLEDIGGRCDFELIKTNFSIEEQRIAISWLLEKKWARIEKEGGKKFLVLSGSNFPLGIDEGILKIVEKEGEIEHKALIKNVRRDFSIGVDEIEGVLRNLTKRRNLLEHVVKKEREIELTEDGRRILEAGLSIEEEITQITPDMLRDGSWRAYKFKKYDVSLPSIRIYSAKKHPYQRILEKIRRIFTEMGFVEIKGELIQSAFWNFDALFVPQDHPAREMQDTFYLGVRGKIEADEEVIKKVKEMHEHGGSLHSKGWGGEWVRSRAEELLLRTHTTAVTIRYLKEHPEPPVKVFCIDRVYRRETPDATHIPEFDQLEGIVMDKGLSLKNLFGYLSVFYKRMGFPSVRFRPGYFPYTEPSVEVEVYTKERGWIELGGAGIFREEVTNPIGVKYPVLAWGLGIGRLAMLILGLKDIRDLYQPDIQWLRETPLFI
ncbi:MAG: phenylalanine--tRNA ligase subunit alpha [Candidatus Methanospirareceae archaeon]